MCLAAKVGKVRNKVSEKGRRVRSETGATESLDTD